MFILSKIPKFTSLPTAKNLTFKFLNYKLRCPFVCVFVCLFVPSAAFLRYHQTSQDLDGSYIVVVNPPPWFFVKGRLDFFVIVRDSVLSSMWTFLDLTKCVN